ncbi:hypothetical protein B4914_05610 [Yersinia entomophaga]|nr:hypothetical protein B4914_05610 [Yersinia entomophaga]
MNDFKHIWLLKRKCILEGGVSGQHRSLAGDGFTLAKTTIEREKPLSNRQGKRSIMKPPMEIRVSL